MAGSQREAQMARKGGTYPQRKKEKKEGKILSPVNTKNNNLARAKEEKDMVCQSRWPKEGA